MNTDKLGRNIDFIAEREAAQLLSRFDAADAWLVGESLKRRAESKGQVVLIETGSMPFRVDPTAGGRSVCAATVPTSLDISTSQAVVRRMLHAPGGGLTGLLGVEQV